MATRPEHDPKNRTPTARLKRVYKHASDNMVGTYLGTMLKFWDEKDCDQGDVLLRALGFTGFLLGTPMLVSTAFIDDQYERSVTSLPQVDMAVAYDQDLGNGEYVGFSADNGQTGYALFRYDDSFRLYSFDRAQDRDGLRLIEDADDAWHISRMFYDDFENLEAVASESESLISENWELYAFPEVGEYVREEDGTILRHFQEMSEAGLDPDLTRAENYAQLKEIWHEASAEFQDDFTGIPQAEFDQRSNGYSTEVSVVNNEFDGMFKIMGSMLLGMGVLGATTGSVGPTRRKIAKKDALKRARPK